MRHRIHRQNEGPIAFADVPADLRFGVPQSFGVPQNSTFLFAGGTRSKANTICGHAMRVHHPSFRPIGPVDRVKHAKTIWGTPKPFGVPQNSTFVIVTETRQKANTTCGHTTGP
jgi:hypothetical protein